MRYFIPVLFLAACCPIPWRVTALVQPTLQIAVRGPTGGLSNARVVIARYEYYPHYRPETERKAEFTTDELGRLTVEEKREKETVYPLMMHGIGGYAFHVCAQAPGHQTQIVHWSEPMVDDDPQPEDYQVAFTMEPGDSVACESGLKQGRILTSEPVKVSQPE